MTLELNGQLVGIGSATMYIDPPVDQVVNPPPSGGDAATFSTNAKGQPETYDDSVYRDDDLEQERNAVKSLCPRGDARWVFTGLDTATNDNWSNPLNWYDTTDEDQTVPDVTAGTVLIPQGTTCVYDIAAGSEVDLSWVRVDGDLEFDVTANRNWSADFTFIDHTGSFTCGTVASPVPQNITINIVPYRTDDMDFATDRMKLGRGLLCFDGTVSIVGTEKVAFARSTAAASATDTTVTLDTRVVGNPSFAGDWEVGDELEITGSVMRGWPIDQAINGWQNWDVEIVTISSIDNSTPTAPVITFSPALTNDRPADAIDPTRLFHVINRTRNIRFDSPNGAAQEVWRRPHTLFKGNGGINVSYAEIRNFGRTDHRDIVLKDGTTYGPLDYETYSPSGAYTAWNGPTFMASGNPTTATTNFQGRYPLHAHRCGFDDLASPPVIFKGCVVVNGASWGIVHHDSHANITECVASDCMSGGIVSEGGGSIGTWLRCISGNSKESHRKFSTVQVKVGGGVFGDIGHAYWGNSRTVKFDSCIAHDANGGFLLTSRASSAQGTNVYPGATDEPKAFYGQAEIPGTTVQKAFAPIQQFENCEAYACVVGLGVAKKQAHQHHNVRSILKNFRAWEVQCGIHVQYTGHYSFLDPYVTGYNVANQVGLNVKPDKAYDIAANAMDVVFVNPRAENFDIGVRMAEIQAYPLAFKVSHKIINQTFTDVTKEFALSNSGTEITSFPYTIEVPGSNDYDVLTSGEVSAPAPITYDWTSTVDEHYFDGNCYIIFGSYTDRLGTLDRILGRPNPDKFGGKTVVDSQDDITGNTGKATTNFGFNILIYSSQMEQLIRNNGLYTKANGELVLLLPDLIMDRFDATITYFDHPVAMRITQTQLNNIASVGPIADNGALPAEYDAFNPAGTIPNLTIPS